MSTIFRVYPMKFDTEKWAAVMNGDWAKDDIQKGYLLGVNPSTISGWRKLYLEPNFPHPNMHNFLNVCNLLDLNPQDFFILDDSEANSDA